MDTFNVNGDNAAIMRVSSQLRRAGVAKPISDVFTPDDVNFTVPQENADLLVELCEQNSLTCEMV